MGKPKWSVLGHGVQHVIFRVVALVFSAMSAMAIYWLFSAFGSGLFQQVLTYGTTIGFVALGYFVMRGLSHRLKHKQRIRSYVLVAVLYLFVEIVCNFARAMADYSSLAWIEHLTGWHHAFFAVAVPLVLSIMPLFGVALANIDVDLALERGTAPVHNAAAGRPMVPQFKPGPASQVVIPMGSGGQATSASQPVPNALQNWWANRSSAGKQQDGPPQMAMNGHHQQYP